MERMISQEPDRLAEIISRLPVGVVWQLPLDVLIAQACFACCLWQCMIKQVRLHTCMLALQAR